MPGPYGHDGRADPATATVAQRASRDTLGGMCSRVMCPSCQRPTYAGCGNHVEEVLGDVPLDERCQCGSGEQPKPASMLRSLFRRR
jgi:hypothetical protein